MSVSSTHQDLFHQPSAAEKISFVRSLMETGDLQADVAMALLKSIHTELADPQGQDHSSYASYARMMASLQHTMPDVHQHVVENWQASQRVQVEPEEGFVETEPSGEAKRVEKSSAEEIGQDKEFWETEGGAEGIEAEEERGEIEEKDEGEEREEEKGEIEADDEEESDKEEREDEEPQDEQHEQEDEPEKEPQEDNEVEGDVEESEIEQEELETKEEPGEQEAPEEQEAEGEESEKSEVETGGEAEGNEVAGEGERLATEAAEAVAHMEHAQSEAEIIEEEPEEEEPPMEAAE